MKKGFYYLLIAALAMLALAIYMNATLESEAPDYNKWQPQKVEMGDVWGAEIRIDTVVRYTTDTPIVWRGK